ncbi:c-type cytochrome [Dongia sp.]|uniref:c-type cytochrome n=1 Tax=Dongia sp. TaxID=1977262 RepID=UPI003751D3EB
MRRRWITLTAIGGIVVLGMAAFILLQRTAPPAADPNNAAQVEAGRVVYVENCASCHGEKLEGQPNWRERKADDKLPAPPHDATGHTWHHADSQLFDIIKRGVAAIVPGYQTDMIGFGDRLSDQEIWSVIAYIKSTWPAENLARQMEISRRASGQ